MTKFTGRQALALTLSLAAGAAGPVWAQGCPFKHIAIVVGCPTGGDTDALARPFAKMLPAGIEQAVVVGNRPGAGGSIGGSYVAKPSSADYTLLVAPSIFSSTQPVLKTGGASSDDLLNGFTPVIQTGTLPLFLISSLATGFKSFKDTVISAKAQQLSYGSPSSSSQMYIATRSASPEVVKTVDGPFKEILKMPDVVAKMAAMGTLPLGGAPELLAKADAADFERVGRITKRLGI